jgi:hypothetical protein
LFENAIAYADSKEFCHQWAFSSQQEEDVAWPSLQGFIVALSLGNNDISRAVKLLQFCRALREDSGRGIRAVGDNPGHSVHTNRHSIIHSNIVDDRLLPDHEAGFHFLDAVNFFDEETVKDDFSSIITKVQEAPAVVETAPELVIIIDCQRKRAGYSFVYNCFDTTVLKVGTEVNGVGEDGKSACRKQPIR